MPPIDASIAGVDRKKQAGVAQIAVEQLSGNTRLHGAVLVFL
jgi:hypothetical protein